MEKEKMHVGIIGAGAISGIYLKNMTTLFSDTLKVVNEKDRIVGTIDRDTVYRVQTPQVFDAVLIKGALTKAAEKGLALTDDSAAMDMTGFQTYTVAGEEDNIKITTPRDLMIAEAILKSRDMV